MGLFCILMMVMVAQLYTFVKIHRIASLTRVNFTLYKLYLFGGSQRLWVPTLLSREVVEEMPTTHLSCTGDNLKDAESLCLYYLIVCSSLET